MKFKKFLCAVMVVCILCELVFARQYYKQLNQNTINGYQGQYLNVTNYVFRDTVSYSGHTITTYGVRGQVNCGESLIKTNWTSGGPLETSGGSLYTFSEQTNYEKTYERKKSDDYITYVSYNLYMNSSNVNYGSSTYQKFGDF